VTVALMIWAAIGPLLAFMVGILVGSQDDDETPPPECGWPIPAYPYAESWRQPPGRAVEQPLPAAARPGGRCGSKGQWP